jgi:hypothetical protein
MPKARPQRAVRGSLLPMIREEPNQAKRRAENGRKPARSGDPPDRIDLIDLGPSKGSNRSYRCGSLERIDPASSTGPVPASRSRQILPLRRVRARARARASFVAAPVPLARGFHRPGPAHRGPAQPRPAHREPAQPGPAQPGPAQPGPAQPEPPRCVAAPDFMGRGRDRPPEPPVGRARPSRPTPPYQTGWDGPESGRLRLGRWRPASGRLRPESGRSPRHSCASRLEPCVRSWLPAAPLGARPEAPFPLS